MVEDELDDCRKSSRRGGDVRMFIYSRPECPPMMMMMMVTLKGVDRFLDSQRDFIIIIFRSPSAKIHGGRIVRGQKKMACVM